MDKELIDHIKDNLQAHEEAYTPGAWERFSVPDEKKRSRFFYWPLWSAAAIILVITSIFLLQNDPQNVEHSIVKNTVPKTKKQENSEKENSSKADLVIDKSTRSASVEDKLPLPKDARFKSQSKTFRTKISEVVSNNPFNEAKSETLNPLITNNLANQRRLEETFHSRKANLNSNFSQVQIKIEKKKMPEARMTFEQLLEQDSHKSGLAKTEKSKTITKWEPGVFVAPSMGNDNKVNMNYGFSLSYNLANKLSISSGITYAALSTTSNLMASSGSASDAVANAPSASNAIAYSSASKSFESVDASISGINIPLELKYRISSNFYTGIGVSALAILNNKKNNNYLISSAQNTTIANASGTSTQKMLVVTERISEPQTGPATTTDKYLGFYNFSIGYQQKISKKNNFAVEPFLRLPMKTFSNDKLNLTNGGVRLKFDF
ncbi:hypothetical protein [Pedobacter sp. Leaf176]|uniref:hypothetical protein n=1 Tax=Pedobacter sp. Leaf176 TaxID=1736286 RepID=UPI0006F4A6B5|nr:hypothetical protein [Pedobacter sp. Leaf176]KQR71317.1 hypothetical protein ASF92_07990 [Pedobacter sp. Leaf176]